MTPDPTAARTNKPALCLDKIRKCRSVDWKGIKSENAENADWGDQGGSFCFIFYFMKFWSETGDSLIVCAVNHV
jgi:hypothetical protein